MSQNFFYANAIKKDQRYDKNIMLVDDCEGSCNWTKIVSGCTGSVIYDTSAAKYGTKGLLISTQDAAPQIGDYAAATRNIENPQNKNIELSLNIKFSDITKIDRVIIYLYAANGTRLYRARIIIYPNEGIVKYTNSGNTETEITDLARTFINNMWYKIVLAIDTVNMLYKNIKFGSDNYEFNNISMHNNSADSSVYMTNGYLILNKEAAISTIFLDSIIITQKII